MQKSAAVNQPTVLAAIHDEGGYLLTGEVSHFDHLYGRPIEGVLVVQPAPYFGRRRRG